MFLRISRHYCKGSSDMAEQQFHIALSGAERTLIEAIYADDQDQRARGLSSEERTRNVDLNTGAFLWQMVVATRPKRILEIGSSTGLSTLFLASAARWVGAMVVGTEVIAERAETNNRQLQEANLADIAVVVNKDHRVADDVIAYTWDFVFIDAEKDDYPGHLQAIEPLLNAGAVILADNVISHDCSVYQEYVRTSGKYVTTTVTQDRGIEFSIFQP
jgi:caffeoyl-CoA O-methyltransferase